MSGTNHKGQVFRRRPPIVAVAIFCLLPFTAVAFVPPQAMRSQKFISQPMRSTQTRIELFPRKQTEHANTQKVRATTLAVDPSSSQQKKSTTPLGTVKNQKLKILKDKMWIRETKEDLTAAEFACSLEATSKGDDEKRKKKRKRAVDYEKLLSKLEQSALDLCCDTMEDCPLEVDDVDSLVPSPNGKGSIVYTEEQRAQLLNKILTTRHALKEIMQGHEFEWDEDDDGSPFSIQLPEIQLDIPKEDGSIGTDLGEDSLLYVRDDGTVDWDGALQDRAALKNFGIAVWARINGQDPDLVDEDTVGDGRGGGFEEEKPRVVAKVEETEAIRMEKKRLDELMEEYNDMKAKHLALLNSAISAGQAVANINLATLAPKLRTEIRKSTEQLEKKEEEVSFQTLMYELERIFTYLDGEMASKGSIPLQDRLNVAEFGLLESQIEGLNSQMEAGEIVDPDVLAVVLDQLRDFKRRLGIDYFVTGLTFDRQAIQQWLNELGTKTKDGLAFYVKGCRLFWNDVVFGLSLVGRALRGYTLKPREVRNLRRTVKDIVTFVPVVIILLIPLSPVGHVFVFGAIQRFFPGFFPSCFTESRQNLLQLYESTEYSEVVINETFGEKLSRFSEAFVFIVVNAVRKAYTNLRYGSSVTDQTEADAEADDTQEKQ